MHLFKDEDAASVYGYTGTLCAASCNGLVRKAREAREEDATRVERCTMSKYWATSGSALR
jgi:hypothetical protein